MGNVWAKVSRFGSSLTLRWTSLSCLIVFFGLTVLFMYPNNLYRSVFRQLILSLNIPRYSEVYFQIQTALYVFSLATGLLLIAALIKKAQDIKDAGQLRRLILHG